MVVPDRAAFSTLGESLPEIYHFEGSDVADPSVQLQEMNRDFESDILANTSSETGHRDGSGL
jgi:hypothetical protein